jgi:hypothetical protein
MGIFRCEVCPNRCGEEGLKTDRIRNAEIGERAQKAVTTKATSRFATRIRKRVVVQDSHAGLKPDAYMNQVNKKGGNYSPALFKFILFSSCSVCSDFFGLAGGYDLVNVQAQPFGYTGSVGWIGLVEVLDL